MTAAAWDTVGFSDLRLKETMAAAAALVAALNDRGMTMGTPAALESASAWAADVDWYLAQTVGDSWLADISSATADDPGYWTWNSLFSACGCSYPALDPFGSSGLLGCVSAQWADERRRMLDKLRWRRKTAFFPTVTMRYVHATYQPSFGTRGDMLRDAMTGTVGTTTDTKPFAMWIAKPTSGGRIDVAAYWPHGFPGGETSHAARLFGSRSGSSLGGLFPTAGGALEAVNGEFLCGAPDFTGFEPPEGVTSERAEATGDWVFDQLENLSYYGLGGNQ